MNAVPFVPCVLAAFRLLSFPTPGASQQAPPVVISNTAPSSRADVTVPLPQVKRVKVTYSGGDAAAGPQYLTGKDDSTGVFLTGIHSVTIDFVNLLSDACKGDRSLAEALHQKNPISAIHVLELNVVDPPSR